MLSQSCETLPGVGTALTQKLARCNIQTLGDLLFHLPYRYQDRTRITPIQDLRVQDYAVIIGQIVHTEIQKGRKMMLHCYVQDKTGVIRIRFFHFTKQQTIALAPGKWLTAFGEVRLFAQQHEMIHPEYQLLPHAEQLHVEEHLTPIYKTTANLSQSRLRQLIKLTLTRCEAVLKTFEWLNDEQCSTHRLLRFDKALAFLHAPPPDATLQCLEEGTHPAIKRLILDELMAKQVSLLFAKQKRKTLKSPAMPEHSDLKPKFIASLPFDLTCAQQRVCDEITQELVQDKPMLRLVQGDVGSGKTIVAAIAALHAIGTGYQTALMAPTDLLSEQHANNFKRWLEPLGISVHRLSGKMRGKERKQTFEALSNGSCQMAIGTHALFQEQVIFNKLGLVIIDEQHRFGVEQRLSLQQKGQCEHITPHQLLLTATPIPRTLAMSHFAHMDLSIIDELPPGRTPVATKVLAQAKRDEIVTRLKEALSTGRQAYWVCPLIEESEKLQCIAATSTAEILTEQLKPAKVALIHGRLKADEKEAIMAAFKNHQIDLLVATTVIEVGVDVPNASLMIIENSERLGLSQLHQLRGRVGRGAVASHCLLMYQSPLSYQSTERLKIMRETNDGFVIAEKDLTLRGAGELLGVQQTGYKDYKIACLQRDKLLLPLIKDLASTLLQQNPETARDIATRWLGDFEAYLQG